MSGLATAPFALYHFDRFAGLGLLANLMAMPIVSLISAPLAGASLVLAPFGGSELALRAFGASLEWILVIAAWFDGIAPGGVGPSKAMPPEALIAMTTGMILAMICRGWHVRLIIGSAMLATGAALWWAHPAAAIHWGPSGDVYLVAQDGAVEPDRWRGPEAAALC